MRIWISFSLLLLCLFLKGQDLEQQFYVANQSYEIKEYATAIEQYETILKNGFESAELHYNLGNAYYRFGELGKAILNYERALRLQPNDEDITHNLRIAQSEVRPKLDRLPDFFLTTFKQDVQSSFAPNSWAILFLILLWLGMGGLILWQLGQQRTHRKWGFIAGFLLLSIALAAFFFSYTSNKTDKNSGQAIVLEEETALRKGANKGSAEILTLREGIKVKLLNTTIQNWQKVKLSNGQEGWLPSEVIEEI